MTANRALPVPGFAAYVRVRHYEMDALGHVNNAVYLHYLEQAALEHSAALGCTGERLRELGGLFIVHRHEIDYLRPAAAGDTLQIVTWAAEMRGALAVRDYTIQLLPREVADTGLPASALLPAGYVPESAPIVRARTRWVWVGATDFRPRRMPPALRECFSATAVSRGEALRVP